MELDYVLQMNHIEKEYFGNKVLKNVNLAVKPGEILALVGENGAGKSTLMNILFGMPVIQISGGFKGQVIFNGNQVNISSPMQALDLGIGMVHQEFMLIQGFSITENIKLNREITKHNIVSRLLGENLKSLDKKKMGDDARTALNKISVDLDEWVKIEGLPVGYMQFIEIAREIDKTNVKLIVFDEPTAVLTESEAQRLLDCVKKIAASGIAIIFISHRLDEVLQLADKIVILRDGELIACRRKEETSLADLAQLMIGRKMEKDIAKADNPKITNEKMPLMTIKNLTVHMPGEEVKGIDLTIFRGEILGFGGLAGQGKIGIANGIMGIHDSAGEIYYKEVS